jgi:hypothetical protein
MPTLPPPIAIGISGAQPHACAPAALVRAVEEERDWVLMGTYGHGDCVDLLSFDKHLAQNCRKLHQRHERVSSDRGLCETAAMIGWICPNG